MALQGTEGVMISTILGTLAAVVYGLRVLVLMEKRLARIEKLLERGHQGNL